MAAKVSVLIGKFILQNVLSMRQHALKNRLRAAMSAVKCAVLLDN